MIRRQRQNAVSVRFKRFKRHDKLRRDAALHGNAGVAELLFDPPQPVLRCIVMHRTVAVAIIGPAHGDIFRIEMIAVAVRDQAVSDHVPVQPEPLGMPYRVGRKIEKKPSVHKRLGARTQVASARRARCRTYTAVAKKRRDPLIGGRSEIQNLHDGIIIS